MKPTENTAVIVFSKLTPEEKAECVDKLKAFAAKYDIELVLPEHLK